MKLWTRLFSAIGTTMLFDADALLAALPKRIIRPLGVEAAINSVRRPPVPQSSSVLLKGSYNGFSDRERNRTATLSNWLAKMGCTERPGTCDICQASADDEHAEDYYDLTSWIGLCRRCHRSALHGRFARPERWTALLDEHHVAEGHWSRLVSSTPFDMAALQRARGFHEPIKADYVVASNR